MLVCNDGGPGIDPRRRRPFAIGTAGTYRHAMGFLDKLLGRTKQATDDAGEKAGSLGDKAEDAGEKAWDKGTDAAGDTADEAKDTVSDLTDRGEDAASDAPASDSSAA
jgi:hypothetical protein